MSYALIQAGYATVIKKLTGYDGDNVKEGDWRIMGHGKASFVVLQPGTFQQREAGLRNTNEIVWRTNIELYVPYDGEGYTTLATLIAERQKIIDVINLWPHLGAVSGVMDAMIVGGGEVERTTEGRQFYRQVLVGETVESVTFTRSE